MTQPAIFISHGGPNIITDDSEARDFLKSLGGMTGKPRAIVIASAHFETDGVAVVSDPAPEMIYDFGGFAPELYQMVYPAPGSPELAQKVHDLLDGAGLAPKMVEKRGYDHGTWTTMKLAFPQADIPIVQVSIDPHRDAEYHFRLGRALAGLREDNILVVGSGHITHNLRAVFSAMRAGIETDPQMTAKVAAFTEWFAEKFEEGASESLLEWNRQAPYAQENHPTDEHLMPLFFAWGAGGEDAHACRIHASRQFGFFAFDAWKFA